MSWEIFKTKEIPCLCGTGKIAQKLLCDDWNRVRETNPVIECQICCKKYEVISEIHKNKPYHDQIIYYCVDKEIGEKIRINL